MYHFFVEPSQISDRSVIITGDDVNHIKNVLRLKQGDEISVSNGIDGRDYRCGIEEITDAEVVCTLRFIKEDGVELPSRVYLFQGLPKGDKMEFIIQKMVELGVYEIIPVAMKRCVVKLDDRKAKAKTARWQGISEAAAKQSRRGLVPGVREVMSYQEALEYAGNMDVKLVPYEMEALLDGAAGMAGTRKVMEHLKPGQSVAVLIGPEGGFEENEIQAAADCGMTPITLGKRILRTETAGMTVMAWIMYQLEDR
ncbi:MAG: 16S rRNA (uracil(1498)-N(3))-methyltransferase [Lachnospiraceae bacterium]|nr:16S rRNA (uracil(1498)-N(3))-methyltransferase [Lachnospiraceae bacterium]